MLGFLRKSRYIIYFSGKIFTANMQHKHRVFHHCKYSTKTNPSVFFGEKDRFNGITIDTAKINIGNEEFSTRLEDSLSQWLSEGKRCVWFRVNIKDSKLVPVLAQKGFNFHHARGDFVMMYKWLPEDSKANLPPSCHTNLGVGAMVFDKNEKLLVVSEKHYDYPHWKLPGGYVEIGEDITAAAEREVKEETGIECTFQSLVTFRHTHNMMYGNSDIYILLMMKALTEKINISQREVNACQWMDVEEYTNHPHVHEFNRLIVNKALEYKRRNIKLNIQKRTVKWAANVREMNYLMIEDFK